MFSLRGTLRSFFQIGGSAGPALKRNGAALELRNPADSAFAVMRGAPPVNGNDLTTKAYVDSLAGTSVWTQLAAAPGSGVPVLAAGPHRRVVYGSVTLTGGGGTGAGKWSVESGVGTGIYNDVQPMSSTANGAIVFAYSFSVQAGRNYKWTDTSGGGGSSVVNAYSFEDS